MELTMWKKIVFIYIEYILITLVVLSLNRKSPSINRCRSWGAAQPFIGPHKSNIVLCCFNSFSKFSLFVSWVCMCRVKKREEKNKFKTRHNQM